MHEASGTHELSVNQYRGAIHPQGHLLQTEFRLDPFPVFVYGVGEVALEKRVFMVHGQDTVVVRYLVLSAPEAIVLTVRPLISGRDFHSLVRENPALDGAVERRPHLVRLSPYPGLPSLHLSPSQDDFLPDSCWYNDFEYREEIWRGLDAHEDLYSPGVFRFHLSPGERCHLVASVEDPRDLDVAQAERREVQRRATLTASLAIKPPRSEEQEAAVQLPAEDDLVQALVLAADTFVVHRASTSSPTLIAGYHWFGDWGRDAMISIPGLTLVTGRQEIAGDILRTFASYADQGMIPNYFPDRGGQPEYNTIDATLWLFYAAYKYLEYTGNKDFVRRELYPTLWDIIQWHERGTRCGIRVDADGLLTCSREGAQLTWMDAKLGDWVVTPRWGKAVEVNALWYNALRILELFARLSDRGHQAAQLKVTAEKVERNFASVFWNRERDCLFDCVREDGPDATLRPNQLLAVSLPFRLLSRQKEAAVLRLAQERLLTFWGLRTLAPGEPGYSPHCSGDQTSRDAAYHQGTVWPWLLGPFVAAYLRVHGRDAQTVRRVQEFLEPMRFHLAHAGLGTISEIFDAEPPHFARGCISQAWSVAEVLRVYSEEVLARPLVKGVRRLTQEELQSL